MTSPKAGAEEIRESLRHATVLAFPKPRPDGGDGGGAGTAATPAGPTTHPLTDLGNAERFRDQHERALCYCPSLGWLAWDGLRWSRKSADEIVDRLAQDTARSMQEEADELKNAPGVDFVVREETKSKPPVFLSDQIKAWGRVSESAAKLAAIPKLAAARMAVPVEAFDADPMRINVWNGTLAVSRDIEDGYIELRPHDPADHITRLAPVNYDPHATCPTFDRFLEEIQPNADMRRFLLTWFGYSLTGDTGEQKMVFLYKKGRNGKGVLVSIVSHVAGDLADMIPIESFLDSGRARAGGQATPDIAALPGVRLLSTSEPKKGATLDEAFVKLFTGGDKIKARHLNKDFFSFVPHAKLTMQGNYRPKVTGADEGIWSRILLVPCSFFIPPERRDPKLLEKLKAESSGILNRLLDGLRHWLDYGLVLPEGVAEATERYRDDSDPLGRFLEECTRPRIGGRVTATVMHTLFLAWAKAAGESEWRVKGLGMALKERGLASKRSNGSVWIDVELTKSGLDFEGGAVSG